MARYLVVANQTALSPELSQCLLAIAAEHPDAQFVLVVPATPVEHLLGNEEGHAEEIAQRRAAKALAHFHGLGIPVVDAHTGSSRLLYAIEESLRPYPKEFGGIVISTFPKGVSRWLEPDPFERLEQAFHLPVTHVVAIHGEIAEARHTSSSSPGILRQP